MLGNRVKAAVFAGLCFITGFLASAPATSLINAQTRKGVAPAEKDERAADRAAVREMLQAFGAAFQNGDAATAAEFMTPGAELAHDEGLPVRGREAIQKAFAEHFAKKEKVKITLEPESLRFPSRDTAVEEGHMKVLPEKGEATTNRYRLMLVREDGKWLLSAIHEWESEQASLRDLEWLIGTWSAKRKDAEVDTVYEWFGNKAFLRARFTIREKDKTLNGMQLIGIDPQTGALRIWIFENDGGIGEGTVARDGKKWVFESATTLTNGDVLTASNILLQVDADTFTWQPVNLAVNGSQVKDLPPVKVTRVKDKK